MYEIVIETPPTPSYIRIVDDGGWMPSVYRSRYGRAIDLRPLIAGETTEPARLVFQAVPDAEGKERFYNLVPGGDFLIRLARLPDAVDPPPPRQQELLCGLAGTEFVRFDPDEAQPSTVIRFHPNQPAFAPRFPLFPPDAPRGVRVQAVAGDELLTRTYKTAWVSLAPRAAGPAPTYTSQPRTAPLFRAGPPSSAPLLEHYAPDLAALTHTRIFPMVGYGSSGPRAGVQPPAPDLEAFEAQILAPVRFERIGAPLVGPVAAAFAASRGVPGGIGGAHAAGGAGAGDVLARFDALTPQGLRVTVEDGRWRVVYLAQTVDAAGQESSVAFHDPPPALVSALQASDLFLVISNRKQVGQFDGRVVMDGWPFTIALDAGGGAQSTRNILILKFGSGTVKSRAADVSAWTQADDFNDSPAQLSYWLTSYLADAEVAAPAEPTLTDFVRIVNDEHWNGILALRVDVDLQAFPKELKGLLGGMDLTRFYGHHLGVLQNRPPQEREAQDSSLFAR